MLGIIGGSGLYQLDALENPVWKAVSTPFGAPSDALLFGKLHGHPVVFLPRHGRGHRLSPTEINFRANIAALKSVGVTQIVSLSAVGSLKEELPPGTFVLVDQFIDRTVHRTGSFFGDGVVAHVSMAHCVCARVQDAIAAAGKGAGIELRRGGTYMVMEGPQFSSQAESQLHRAQGADVIGMTNQPEARLAREAELCYATVAMVTDFDCWHPDHAHVTAAEVVKTLTQNSAKARALVVAMAKELGGVRGSCAQGCDHALDHAVMTAPDARPAATVERLKSVSARVFGAPAGASRFNALIRTIPDFPRKGIQFRDVTTLFKDGPGFREAIDALAARYRDQKVDLIAGIEARGFVLGAALAYALGVGFVPLRKSGKLPGKTLRQAYQLEYGTDSIELHDDAVVPGSRVVLVDDLIATGGTAGAGAALLKSAGAQVLEAAFLVDLPELHGRERLEKAGLKVFSLCEFEGE